MEYYPQDTINFTTKKEKNYDHYSDNQLNQSLVQIKIEYDSEESINVCEYEGKKHDQDYLGMQTNWLLEETKLENNMEAMIHFSKHDDMTYNNNLSNSLNKPLEWIKMECTTEMNRSLEQATVDNVTDKSISFTEQEGIHSQGSNLPNPMNQALVHVKMECNIEEQIDFNGKEDTRSNLVHKMKQPLEYIKMELTTEEGIYLTESIKSEPNNLLNRVDQDLEEQFHCSKCNFQTNLEMKVSSHLRKELGEGKNKSKTKCNFVATCKKIFCCHKCAFKTHLKSNLKKHICTLSGNKIFQCSECEYKIENDGKFKTHKWNQLCEHKSNSIDQSSENHLSSHLGNRSTEYVFSCKDCNFTSNLKWKSKNHQMEHCGEYKFHCPECEYKSNRTDHFKLHLSIHSGKYKFHCTRCEYKTNRGDRFKLHMGNHGSDRVKLHKGTHGRKYVFKCKECEYKTIIHLQFLLHKRKHSEEYKFQCTECEYKANRSDLVENHKSTHSGKYRFNCKECEYKCNKKRYFTWHQSRHIRNKKQL